MSVSDNTPKRPAPRTAWKPGQCPNPGGQPKGKRISTWMAEFGEMSDAELAAARKRKDLPQNAKIALARLDEALEANGKVGLGATETILERTEGKVEQKLSADLSVTKRMVLVFPKDNE